MGRWANVAAREAVIVKAITMTLADFGVWFDRQEDPAAPPKTRDISHKRPFTQFPPGVMAGPCPHGVVRVLEPGQRPVRRVRSNNDIVKGIIQGPGNERDVTGSPRWHPHGDRRSCSREPRYWALPTDPGPGCPSLISKRATWGILCPNTSTTVPHWRGSPCTRRARSGL